MKKPKKQKREYFDYNECRDYLEAKYNYDESDYGGQDAFIDKIRDEMFAKYGKSWYNKVPTRDQFTKNEAAAYAEYWRRVDDEKPPYRDFWLWVIERHDVTNGCFITFSQEELDEGYNMEDWQKEIYKRYLDEFADENGELEMYVWW